MQLVDLSQDIYQGMQVYPGHLKTVVFDHASHEETALRFVGGFSFQTKGFMINDNGPTHVDSFSHLDPDPSAQTIDQMSLDLFYGPAVCLDVSHVGAGQDITAEHLDAAEAAVDVDVRAGRHPAAAHRDPRQVRRDVEVPQRVPRAGRDRQPVDRRPWRQDVRRGQPDAGQPDQQVLPVPHDVPPATTSPTTRTSPTSTS